MVTKLNILLVDDDALEHKIFKETVKATPFDQSTVSSVYDGYQALNFLFKEGAYLNRHDGSPDVIIVDINMPIMNGLKLLEILKTNKSLNHIPVYMLTKARIAMQEDKCHQLGCAGFYTKPISIEKLHHLLEETLELSKSA